MRRMLVVATMAGLLAACGERAQPVAAAPPAPPAGQVGTATWYGERHEGRPTASGEIFDKDDMTAAHRTLPLGSRVRVVNVSTGAAQEVRITDRCVCRGSVIDLSKAAAASIGIPTQGGGTGQVRIEQR